MELSILKPADIWFWLFLVICFITIVYSFLLIKNHPDLKLLITFRSITFIVIIILLLQPKFSWIQFNYNKLDWNLYIDNSVSISYHPTISFQTIKTEFEQIIYAISKKNILTNLFSFSDKVNKIESPNILNASGPSTDLSEVLNHIKLNQDKLAGAIVITDGQNNHGIDPQNSIKNIKVPVFTLGIGESKPLIDLSIESVDAPTVAIKGDNVNINVIVHSLGELNEKINVMLFSEKKMIGSKFLNISGKGSRNEARFIFNPINLGENEYIVKVSSLAEEINIDNNQQKFFITILKDRYKVALITGAPSFNTSVIKDYINKYPRVELDHFVRSKNGYYPELKLFWSRPYQLIIFDNYPIDALKTKTQKIFSKKISSEKASLLWILGRNITKKTAPTLTPFFHLDLIQENFNVDNKSWYFTEELINSNLMQGLLTSSDDHFSDIFPPITIPYVFNSNHNEVYPIAYHETSEAVPLLLMGEVKNIRSIVWTSNDFSTIKYNISNSNNNFDEIWSKLFSWLLKTGGDKNLYFRLNKESYQQGEEIMISGSIIKDYVNINNQAFITIIKDSIEINSFELRFNPESVRWEGNFWAPEPGDYHYKVIIQDGSVEPMQQDGKFIVEKSQVELNHVSLNSSLLEVISNNTDAEYYPWRFRSSMVKKIEPIESKRKINKSITLNENKWVMIVLILLLTIEWVYRKKIGLP